MERPADPPARPGEPDPPPGDEAVLRSLRPPPLASRFLDGTHFVLVRFVLLRWLALVYLVAFLVAARQGPPLIGPDGLEPAALLLDQVQLAQGDSRWQGFWQLPTVFWLTGASAGALRAVAWAGVALSAAALAGVTNALVQLALWALYLSLVQVGQTFYGFGWESQLLETGMLAVFLCPARRLGPFASSPPAVTVWMFRWLIARVMLGAGLIKLRGDACWRDLTCLLYHYETQPNPSPVSYVLHAMPPWVHRAGVLVNHAVELVAPWLAFGPRRLRLGAGAAFVAFQAALIVSGNLSFLNWLTIVPAWACLDDEALGRLLPGGLRGRWASRGRPPPPSRAQSVSAWLYAAIVAALSVAPVANLLSARQAMNRGYDRLHLVNTYGAFGSVGKERHEVIVLGTSSPAPTSEADWREYQFPCKPGDVARRPCLVTPYHHRLDWQLWFAGFSSPAREPWLVHLVAKLLRGDPTVKTLLAHDPFPGEPPRLVRVDLYRYAFTRPGDGSGAWWRRERLGGYLPPLSRDDPRLARFLAAQGW